MYVAIPNQILSCKINERKRNKKLKFLIIKQNTIMVPTPNKLIPIYRYQYKYSFIIDRGVEFI